MKGEIRSTGYYVVGPGSIHPDSGEPYTILADRPLAPVPSFVLRLSGFVAPRPQADSTEKVEPSGRHYYLVARGRELHFAGLAGKGLEDAIRWLYFNRCERDGAKDERIAHGGEARDIAKWIEDHPALYPLETRDFIALRHAEKDDEKVKAAWSGQLNLFNNSADEAFDYLAAALRQRGSGEPQVERIVSASPLWQQFMNVEGSPNE